MKNVLVGVLVCFDFTMVFPVRGFSDIIDIHPVVFVCLRSTLTNFLVTSGVTCVYYLCLLHSVCVHTGTHRIFPLLKLFRCPRSSCFDLTTSGNAASSPVLTTLLATGKRSHYKSNLVLGTPLFRLLLLSIPSGVDFSASLFVVECPCTWVSPGLGKPNIDSSSSRSWPAPK